MVIENLLNQCPSGFRLIKFAGDKWGWGYANEGSVGLRTPEEAVRKFLFWWGKYGKKE